MNFERLRWGEWIAGIAAVDLLLVTFRAWYKVTGTDLHVSAWDALDNGRYLLIATAVVGLFLVFIVAADQASELGFPPGALAAIVGLACAVYVAYRLATPPSDALEADTGIYIGLAGALGVAIGGLLSSREPFAARAYEARADRGPGRGVADAPAGSAAATTAPVGPLVPDTSNTWSSAPAPATTWSPAAVPPATTAAAATGTAAVVGASALQPGAEVVLTDGIPRFPAGTPARVVEVFGGGALVEVIAHDGVIERFELPQHAYEPIAAGPAAVQGDWTPAMPAPADTGTSDAGDDWGFDEPGALAGGAAAGAALGDDAFAVQSEAPKEKVPWWKREIGRKKKVEPTVVETWAAGELAAAQLAEGEPEARPGFLKRVFGGGKGIDTVAQNGAMLPHGDLPPFALEAEATPATDVAGIGSAAESDTAIGESATVADEPAADAPDRAATADPDVPAVADDADATPSEAPAPEPKAAADSEPPTPEPEAIADSEPATPRPEAVVEPEAAPAAPPEPELAGEPAPEAADPIAESPEPEQPSTAAESVADMPEPVAETPEPEAPTPEPEPEPPVPEPGAAAAVSGLGAAAAAGGSEGDEPEAEPKRRRSSGSRNVPKKAVAAAASENGPPKVGETVALKVAGGKYDAGTHGRVVDVFSAGVIVELTDDLGRTDRLDLPFEAIGPTDA